MREVLWVATFIAVAYIIFLTWVWALGRHFERIDNEERKKSFPG